MGLLKRDPTAIRFVRNLLVAFLPAAVIGFAAAQADRGAARQSPIVVAVALIVGGVAILRIERCAQGRRRQGRRRHSAAARSIGIGLIQCLAMIPGVSRSGATILGALSAGRRAAHGGRVQLLPRDPDDARRDGAASWSSNRHELATAHGRVRADRDRLRRRVPRRAGRDRWFIGDRHAARLRPFAWYRIAAGAAALVWLMRK